MELKDYEKTYEQAVKERGESAYEWTPRPVSYALIAVINAVLEEAARTIDDMKGYSENDYSRSIRDLKLP